MAQRTGVHLDAASGHEGVDPGDGSGLGIHLADGEALRAGGQACAVWGAGGGAAQQGKGMRTQEGTIVVGGIDMGTALAQYTRGLPAHRWRLPCDCCACCIKGPAPAACPAPWLALESRQFALMYRALSGTRMSVPLQRVHVPSARKHVHRSTRVGVHAGPAQHACAKAAREAAASHAPGHGRALCMGSRAGGLTGVAGRAVGVVGGLLACLQGSGSGGCSG